jgi:hypothetical protein
MRQSKEQLQTKKNPNSVPTAVEQLPRKLFPSPERRGKIPVLTFKQAPEVPVWDLESGVSI